MRVALLVSNCKVCMDIGIAWIDLARLQDCVRLHGGSRLIASLVFQLCKLPCQQDLLYMCKAEKWLRGRNALQTQFPCINTSTLPMLPKLHNFMLLVCKDHMVLSLQVCVKVFLHFA